MSSIVVVILDAQPRLATSYLLKGKLYVYEVMHSAFINTETIEMM